MSTETATSRYFDLKGDTTRVEINLQETDRPLVITGPIAVDGSAASTLYALEQTPSVKEISEGAYLSATDASKLTVAELDTRFGETDGYPATGTKADKLAFVQAQHEEV